MANIATVFVRVDQQSGTVVTAEDILDAATWRRGTYNIPFWHRRTGSLLDVQLGTRWTGTRVLDLVWESFGEQLDSAWVRHGEDGSDDPDVIEHRTHRTATEDLGQPRWCRFGYDSIRVRLLPSTADRIPDALTDLKWQVHHGWWQAPIAGWRYGQNERKSWFADETTASRETPSTPEIAYWGLPSEEWLDDWRSTTKLPSRLIDALADAEPQLSGVELTWKGRPVAAAERIEHMATGRPTRLVTEPEAPWGWWSLDDWDNCVDEQFLTAFGDGTNHR